MTAPDLLERAVATHRAVDADPRGHADAAAAVVAEARRAGAVEALVVGLRAEAWAHRAQLADSRAKTLLDEAARLARRHRLHRRLGEVLVTRAAVNHELGRLAAAQRDLDAARGLVDDATARQRTLQQAVLHQNTGHLDAAASLYSRLLSAPDSPVELVGKVANNLGMLEAQRGRTDAALRCLDRAAAAAAQVGPALAASVVDSRAWVCMQAGRLTEGLRLFDEAAALLRAAGLPLGELYTGYADVLADLRLLPEASQAADRAVAVLEAGGVPLMAAEARLRAARLCLLAGDADAAARGARAAVSAFREQRRPAWVARATLLAVEAAHAAGRAGADDLRAARAAAADLDRRGVRSDAVRAHLGAGRVALRLGRSAVASEELARAARLARGAPVLTRLDGRVAAALDRRAHGDDVALLRHCRAGLRDLVAHRASLPSAELRALASGHGAELGRLGLAVLLDRGSPPRVLDWMERTRAAALSMLDPVPAAAGAGDHTELRTAPPEGAAATTRGGDDEGRREVEAKLRRAGWVRESATARVGDVVGVAGLRAALRDRVLVEYAVHDGDLVAVVVLPRTSRLVRLGPAAGVDGHAEALAFALRRLTLPRPPAALGAARASADASLRALRAALVEPLGLPPAAPVVVVPVGGLHGLPWSALHDGPVGVAPSASAWARTAGPPPRADTALPAGRVPSQAPVRARSRTVLAAGPDLPGAAAECRALAGLHGDATVLAPPASTVDAVVAALDGADLAHLACHGSLRADNPAFSALRLSDGPLTLHELESRGVAPRRVVLASCESGAHVGYAGDEVLGFVAALMARGTAAVLASTLVVSDVASVALMCGVHERLLEGATLADALHAARADLDTDDPRTFVAWSAYTAYGAA